MLTPHIHLSLLSCAHSSVTFVRLGVGFLFVFVRVRVQATLDLGPFHAVDALGNYARTALVAVLLVGGATPVRSCAVLAGFAEFLARIDDNWAAAYQCNIRPDIT